jgi:hypothetical protein
MKSGSKTLASYMMERNKKFEGGRNFPTVRIRGKVYGA